VKTDLSKLARKRWIEECSNKEITASCSLSPITVRQHLSRLKKKSDLEGLDLSKTKKANIFKKWQSK
jgi:DNA-binding transcriptional ArsR family regulator